MSLASASIGWVFKGIFKHRHTIYTNWLTGLKNVPTQLAEPKTYVCCRRTAQQKKKTTPLQYLLAKQQGRAEKKEDQVTKGVF